METISALLAFGRGKPPVTGIFPSQTLVTRSFVFFDWGLIENVYICTDVNNLSPWKMRKFWVMI